VLIVTHPDLIEFFGVIGINGEEFNSFIQGEGFIHGLLENPEIEREPTYIPVEVFVFAHLMQILIQM